MGKYLYLGKLADSYMAFRLAQERRSLLWTLREIFCKRFLVPGCIWETRDGALVICIASKYPWRNDIAVAPVVCTPSAEACRSARIKRSRRYLPHFSVEIHGRMMYADLKRSYLMQTAFMREFILRLPLTKKECLGMEIARTRAEYAILGCL